MKVVRTVKYETVDGRQHDNEADAKRHETNLQAASELRALLKESLFGTSMRPEAIIQHILLENSAVSAILANYRKRQPKDTRDTIKLEEAAA